MVLTTDHQDLQQKSQESQGKGFNSPQLGGSQPVQPDSRNPGRPDILHAGRAWHAGATRQFPAEPFFTKAGIAHNSVSEAIDSLEHLSKTRDPRMTEAAHQEQVNKQAEKAARQIEAKRDAVFNEFFMGAEKAEEHILERLGLSEEGRYATEIRNRLMGMKEGDRQIAIQEALMGKDVAVLAAVLHAPPFLSGMSNEQKFHLRERYMQLNAAPAYKMLKEMRESASRVHDAYRTASDYISKTFTANKHEPQTKKAQEASTRFNDVLANL
ncbi:hypothetical protein QPM17_00475 [Marinobacter sp. TBZ242]|uniref:Uncharacterized protein n=1 Tax=Marinobacter azerbaijanicus TaxID=3050455 RepID=A0ABT7I671_9GAMM|nr:hypothetical protein [Marinobacter sp. TBZ242]MDL0429586.1 hypothetical protein [Marinobacter sp. TBZ242]